MTIFLRESDVEHLVTMKMALEAVEQAFRLQGENKTDNTPRRRCRLGSGYLHTMTASLPTLGLAGFKSYANTGNEAYFLVHLYGGQEGALLAVIEGNRLGQMRTGAASGIATKYMARHDASRLGIIGTGWQARSQVLAMCAVRPIKTVVAFGRDQERREKFCKEMADILKINVQPASTPEEAVKEMDIVVTATTAREPVFKGEWLAKGSHINAIGSNHALRREIDETTIGRSACVVVDSAEQARLESGDLLRAAEVEAFYWEDVRELGAVVTGDFPGREDAAEITLFESLGVAIEDVALAGKIYQAAVTAGLGQPLPF